ncbi:MAG: hydroxymethylbilane synthase [Rhodospirillaceae bacterium]|nr:hydroxymethylbilane synthase [Rhodospirillaceae bacterium]
MILSRIRIGTRGSPLALWQAHDVKRRLQEAHPHLAGDDGVNITIIKTSGDRLQQGPLSEVGGKGLFTKEIEEALLEGSIDMAVHSMKDVPTWFPEGLLIDCLLPRADPRDALIAPNARSIADLPTGTTVGTASLRRKAMLLHKRPELTVVPLRGNVDTRLGRVMSGEVDATFLALAGLNRLGRDDVPATPVPVEEMLPAVCQGIVGVERRGDDDRIAELLVRLNDADASVQAAGERELLAGLDGSCRTPIAAYGDIDGTDLRFRAAIVRPDGSELLSAERRGPASDAAAMGRDAADELRGRAGPGFFDEP